ncbi:hypothetical protein MTR67_006722 [Solanum verrucosum]|uniref:Uncharacterized protein n=1 Tax=Solanum verrucosum TaxID=315347 RepID=A0AAF0PYS8_SOLVR|nr:hypothetical protein MTR67_006722 [Solanum verrucosum]
MTILDIIIWGKILEDWPWKHDWRTRLPLKVTCLAWTALNNACLTYPLGWPSGLGLGLPCWRSQVRNPLPAKARVWPFLEYTQINKGVLHQLEPGSLEELTKSSRKTGG